jgi:hypothetical protein
MMPGRRGRSAGALTLIVSGIALVAGCGGDSSETDSGSSAVGSPDVALTAREADCTDWNDASVEDRQATIEALREFEGGSTTGGTGSTIPDDRAYELFDSYCANEFARAFKLYKLYARAAAFQPPGP